MDPMGTWSHLAAHLSSYSKNDMVAHDLICRDLQLLKRRRHWNTQVLGLVTLLLWIFAIWDGEPVQTNKIYQVLPSDPFGCFKWRFLGLSDLNLGYQQVTWKKLVNSK